VHEARPSAVLLENVRGLASARFATANQILEQLDRNGYDADWQVLNACNYRVPQLRPRFLEATHGTANEGRAEECDDSGDGGGAYLHHLFDSPTAKGARITKWNT
jgi:site-specific DNA-cytosine methylase